MKARARRVDVGTPAREERRRSAESRIAEERAYALEQQRRAAALAEIAANKKRIAELEARAHDAEEDLEARARARVLARERERVERRNERFALAGSREAQEAARHEAWTRLTWRPGFSIGARSNWLDRRACERFIANRFGRPHARAAEVVRGILEAEAECND